ncbi:MAG: DUF3999 family protein [Lysobacteraceae bacterium]
MKPLIVVAGLLLVASVAAATPADYASKWTLVTDKADVYTIMLDEGMYRQITRADLSDLAAFNAGGEELAFGPLPTADRVLRDTWRDAVWFALPTQTAANASDLQLHVSRRADGALTIDTSLSGGSQNATTQVSVTDILIDARAKDRLIDGLAFDFAPNAVSFTAQVDVEASEDLQHWHAVSTGASIAQLSQNGQVLLRRTVEFAPQAATYLRIHATTALPLRAMQLRLRGVGNQPARAELDADFVGRDGNAFVYRLPARIPVDRVSIALADDNAVTRFSIATREQGETQWHAIGDYTAFRLRGAGIALDAEPMDVGTTRAREWRIEPDTAIAKPPRLHFDYQMEFWVLFTHGHAPYVVVAGSKRAQRGTFAIDALVDPLRAHFGAQWLPPFVGRSMLQESAGAAALNGWDATQRRTWLLWGVLVLGALTVIVMVVGLLRKPPESKQ